MSAPFAPQSLDDLESTVSRIASLPRTLWNRFLAVFDLPVRLARHECSYKRKELVKIRDDRASVLGSLMALRDELVASLQAQTSADMRIRLAAFCTQCQITLDTDADSSELITRLERLTNVTLPDRIYAHSLEIQALDLYRPSRLTQIWPQLVFLPPLCLYAAKRAYHSRESLDQLAKDTVETVKSFWNDWLLAPLKEVVKTVRAGDNDGVIITKESVKADLDVSSFH